jgi:hypothetical protein
MGLFGAAGATFGGSRNRNSGNGGGISSFANRGGGISGVIGNMFARIQNPNVQNPNVQNTPRMTGAQMLARIQNPNVQNPNVQNTPRMTGAQMLARIQNPNVQNTTQMQQTPINPNAFNTGLASQLFNQSNTNNGYVDPILSETPGVGTPIVQKKSSPIKQTMDSSVDPLTGQYIDPTMSQGLDPGTVDPMLDQDITSSPQF